LPLADRRGDHAAQSRASRARRPDRSRFGRHRQLARRRGKRRGYDLEPLRARQVEQVDFERFDQILAMDDDNLRELKRLCPPEFQSKVRLLMEYAPTGAERVVADPYFGGDAGFDRVLDVCEQACDGLLSALQRNF
jgi:protein-tyrosine phosphatase